VEPQGLGRGVPTGKVRATCSLEFSGTDILRKRCIGQKALEHPELHRIRTHRGLRLPGHPGDKLTPGEFDRGPDNIAKSGSFPSPCGKRFLLWPVDPEGKSARFDQGCRLMGSGDLDTWPQVPKQILGRTVFSRKSRGQIGSPFLPVVLATREIFARLVPARREWKRVPRLVGRPAGEAFWPKEALGRDR